MVESASFGAAAAYATSAYVDFIQSATIGARADQIRKEYVDVVRVPPTRDDSLRSWSSRYVRVVLARCQGNKRRACDVLEISYHTLMAHLEYTSSRGVSVSLAPAGEAVSACIAEAEPVPAEVVSQS